jgi:hypothetical protein
MGWMGWIGCILALVAVVLLPLALLVYSAVSTAMEFRRKAQPAMDSFFDALAIIFGYARPRSSRIEKRPDYMKTEPRQ